MDRTEKSLDREIMAAWKHAAQDIGIPVRIPFSFATSHGETELYEAHVFDFGGPKGTVTGKVTDDDARGNHKKFGYDASDLGNSH
jgi:hypothetical protein